MSPVMEALRGWGTLARAFYTGARSTAGLSHALGLAVFHGKRTCLLDETGYPLKLIER